MGNSSKLKNCILNVAYVLLPALSIIFFCEYVNSYFQTDRLYAAAKAMLAFSAFVFLIKKVQLFNWASFAVTITLFIIHHFYRMQALESPDILKIVDIYVWIQWVMLMVIIDLIRTFKKENIKRFSVPVCIAYLIVCLLMWICRHTRMDSIILLFPIFVFYLVPLAKEEMDKLIYRFSEAWIVSYFYIMIQSLISNQHVEGRFQGSFAYLGGLGIFLGGVFAAVSFRLIDAKVKYGRKSKSYAAFLILLLSIFYFSWLVNTRTLYLGFATYLAFWFVFISAKADQRKKRALIILLIAILAVVIFFGLMYAGKGIDRKYWRGEIESGGIHGHVAQIMYHLGRMSDKTTMYNAKVFDHKSIWNAIDKFSSGRLSIYKTYLGKITLFGCVGEAIVLGETTINNTHSTYLDYVYLYGIAAGLPFIGWIIYSTVAVTRRWLKNRSVQNLLALSFASMMLGLMITEVQTLYFPTMFMTLICFRTLFYKENQ